MKTLQLFALALLAGLTLPLSAAPLSGTKTVGPTGDYASLTAAIADIQTQTLGGALILELQAAYVCTVETFPLTIPALNGASATNALTIRPQTSATALSITSADTTAATVDLNGAQFVTIDGRPGGAGSNAGSGGGTASQLTIANTNTTFGVALRFINKASGNTIRYTTLRSVNNSNFSGTVVFSTTTGANGNDNNTIDHCDIRDGASTPVNGIYSSGSTGTAAQANSGNIIFNCNIFNFYSANGADAAGVRLDNGNTDWTITGNSFYQTASRAARSLSFGRAIYINSLSGNNFTVTGNFIGGSAPNAGGTAWTTTGTANTYQFVGIQLNAGTTTASSVQGNAIANIVWTSSYNLFTLPGVWSGIYVQAGSANVGTVTGNTIGTGAGTDSVSVTTSAQGGTSSGIGSASSGRVAIANNTIGSITVNGLATSVSASLTGIQVTAGTNTISNNTVGSTTTANSLNAATSSTSTTSQQVTGILSSSNASASITGNTVANLNNNYVGNATAGQIRGIVTSAGVNTITGNTVRNLSTTSKNTNTTTSQSVYGIIDTSTTAGQTVSQNTVHSLANSAASANVNVTGIYFAGPTSGTNVIARNLVHSLAIPSSSSPQLFGMYFAAGTFTAQNNMVRVGLDASGGSTAGASSQSFGIFDQGTTSGRNYYHNSVYLGGTQTSGSTNTFAFVSFGSTNARTFQNNIFVNARNNSGTATGKHYAVSCVGVNGLTAGGNLLLASGTGGVLGIYNNVDRSTLATWQAATGQDTTSAVTDPKFVNPTGSAATGDLHLQASNPAEGKGIPLIDAATGSSSTVTDDFDGQTRSTLTPTDVGADAGTFTWIDSGAPEIVFPLLTSGSTANRVLTGWATITDNVGVSGGASAPRLYYKKSTDADAFGGNTSVDNGWKYVTATGSSPYSFTMNYSLINGGGVSAGDTIQYFVVAQDAANNLGSSPAGATASANPPVQNVNGHGAVNNFSIVTAISGTVTVGSGGTYPSLSGAGGLFAAINAGTLTGNVVVNITSDLTETGGVILNQFLSDNNFPANAYTLTLQPDSSTMRTISGSVNAGLITLNGADRVTIDGRFGGSGRYLTFRNANTGSTASTILFINDASNNSVRSSIVEGATTSSSYGVIGFSTGTVTGNVNNLITGCQVRDLSTGSGVPQMLIGSSGSSSAVANTGNTISNNELFNFNSYGINIAGAGDGMVISGNNIYKVNSGSNILYGITIAGSGTNLITGNSIHDLLTTSFTTYGIFFSGTGTTTIARNRITAFTVTADSATIYGVYAGGGTGSILNVVNNEITLTPGTPGSATLYGLYDQSPGFGSAVNAFFNSVLIGGNETGTLSSWGSLRVNAFGAHTARNNVFFNSRTGGSVSHFAVGSEAVQGSYTASNNVYAGTGVTPESFMDFNAFAPTTPVTFATWQSSTGADANSSAGIAGSGSFTTAMFVSAATGDLHLVPGGNVLVNNMGTPISGVTDDYDGDVRNVTTPSIGSDEFIPTPDIALEQPAGNALTDGVSIKDFGTATINSGTVVAIFKITNTGTANLTGLAAILDGTNAGDFGTTQPASTTLAPGASTTFNVSFTPTVVGTRNAAVHIASNVTGAKNPFDVSLTGTGQTAFQAWATSNSVGNDPNALGSNGIKNLLNFGFGVNPASGGSGSLRYSGTFAGNGTITATGQPVVRIEGNDTRALFVRRKDFVAAGLTYTVQFSPDLSTWQDSADVPGVLADDGSNQVVSVAYPPLVGGLPPKFFRIRVTMQ